MLWIALICSLFVFTCGEGDGGVAPRLPLNDGHHIPALGLGTFLGFDQNGQKPVLENEVRDPVLWALQAGYRMIDTASAYHNEDQVGSAVRLSGVPREHVYIVTKLGLNEPRDVMGALHRSLARLNTTYVDLYLIHNPVSLTPDHKSFDVVDYLETWRGMEEVKLLGLARSIGVSNFNQSQLQRLIDHCDIKPAVLQVEVNLNLAQRELLSFCSSHNITVMAYTPFGSLFDPSPRPPPPRLHHPTLARLAHKYNKTQPQIVLRYLTQRGVIPIPKSVNKERIVENIHIFEFTLDSDDVEELSKFNADYRVVWPSFWQDHPYYPFERKEIPDKDLFGLLNKE